MACCKVNLVPGRLRKVSQ